jgi:putative ABC transport system permease protein
VNEQGSKMGDQAVERLRHGEGAPFFQTVWQDVRFGLRVLCKSPAFAIVAVLTLTLGIGATTAIFTVVDKVLLQPFAGPNPDRIAVLMQTYQGGSSPVISIPKFMMWRDQPRVLEDAALYGFAGTMRVNLLGSDQPKQFKATQVSANFFSLYGIPFVRGRGFTAQEDSPGGPPAAVISSGMWHDRFGSDPDVIGKSINLDGTDRTIVGVMAPLYTPDLPLGDICLPLQADPNSDNPGNQLFAAARLKPGVTLAQAKAATQVIAEQFRRKYPNEMGPKNSFTLETVRQASVAGAKTALLVLFGAVGLVLLIACANIGSLMLARATRRKREISIRVALGAGRARIVRQILTESMLLSLAGGTMGIFAGYFGLRALLALNPVTLPRIGEHAEAISLDWRILLFAFGVSLLAGAISGVIPATKVSRADPAAAINEGGARSGAALSGAKTRSILVICEMALAMVLLVGAALLIRTFRNTSTVNPGFQTHNVLTMDMSLTGVRFQTTAPVAEVVREGRQRLESLPGVLTAAAACCLPLELSYSLPFNIEGQAPKNGPFTGGGSWRSISPGYFNALQIPLLRGRTFTERDDGSAEGVAIINEKMAKEFWPKGDEIGARIVIGKGGGPIFQDRTREIVGMVGDVRDNGLNIDPMPTMYVPVSQVNDRLTVLDGTLIPLQWIIHTRVPPYSLSSEIQRELRIASGGVPVGSIETMDEVEAHSIANERFMTILLTIFAGIALLLAAVGIYGVMAYSVQQRTQEIGIRMTLGASPEHVRRMVVRQGMLLALIGVFFGVASGLALTRVMQSLLFGVKPWDPLMFAVTAILLALVALLACYIPARRASRVDPLVALRHE